MNRFRKSFLRSKLVAAAFTVFSSSTVCAEVDDPTILGATSDDPPSIAVVGNRNITIYQAADNKLLRKNNEFQNVTLYYEYQPTLRRLSNNKIDVKINPSLRSDAERIVQFTLVPANIDRAQLYDAIRQQQIDPYLRLSNLLPIQIFGLKVRLLNGDPISIPLESATPFNRSFAIDVVVDVNRAEAIAKAIQNGATVTVEFDRLVKLSQKTITSIKWSEVKKTKTFRDYNGPSGPSVLTAEQVVDAAQSILSDLKVFHWEELAAKDSGGATTYDYRNHLNSIIGRFLASRKSKLVDFNAWVDTKRFDVPVADYQKLVDTVKRVAYDAKHLNNNEWCEKYSDQLKTLSKSASARNSPASVGIEIGIPNILELGFDAQESTTSSSSENAYEKALNTEDCGKKLVENNYEYETEGTKYIPKSIKVFERNKAAGEITDSEEILTYQIRQRLGRNTWRFSSTEQE